MWELGTLRSKYIWNQITYITRLMNMLLWNQDFTRDMLNGIDLFVTYNFLHYKWQHGIYKDYLAFVNNTFHLKIWLDRNI